MFCAKSSAVTVQCVCPPWQVRRDYDELSVFAEAFIAHEGTLVLVIMRRATEVLVVGMGVALSELFLHAGNATYASLDLYHRPGLARIHESLRFAGTGRSCESRKNMRPAKKKT